MNNMTPSTIGEALYNAPREEVAAWLAMYQSLDDGRYMAEQAGMSYSKLLDMQKQLSEKIIALCHAPVIPITVVQGALQYANIKRQIDKADGISLTRSNIRGKICALLEDYPDDDGVMKLFAKYYDTIGETEEAQRVLEDLELRTVKKTLLSNGYPRKDVEALLKSIEFGG